MQSAIRETIHFYLMDVGGSSQDPQNQGVGPREGWGTRCQHSKDSPVAEAAFKSVSPTSWDRLCRAPMVTGARKTRHVSLAFALGVLIEASCSSASFLPFSEVLKSVGSSFERSRGPGKLRGKISVKGWPGASGATAGAAAKPLPASPHASRLGGARTGCQWR